MDEATGKTLARVNSVTITIKDLLRASEEIHKLPEADRDWEGRAHCLARMFKGKGDKAFAVGCRLEAMGRLIASGKLPHWVMPEAAGGVRMISEPVFLAAAGEPLLFAQNEAYFDPASFVASVLKRAEPDGRA